MRNDMIQSISEAMANRAAVDPLLTLVRAFCAERDRYNANADDDDDDDAHYFWLFDRLTRDTPECWTAEGAAEALRLVASDVKHSVSDVHSAVLASVMGFFAYRA